MCVVVLDWLVLARVGLGWVICAGTFYRADTQTWSQKIDSSVTVFLSQSQESRA